MRKSDFLIFIILLMATGCGLSSEARRSPAAGAASNIIFVTVTPTAAAPVAVVEQPLIEAEAACTDSFKPHPLNHTTTIAGDTVRLFDSNGSGLAINDLDQDGDLDLVLANLNGPNSIFWNEGHLTFRQDTDSLPYNDARAVSTVDVNGDGWQDIVLTRRTTSPLYWRNNGATGQPGFTRTNLPGVDQPAYALAWGDMDGDGDLDLVTGSYDAELSKELGNTFLFGPGAGVFYYENQAGQFEATRLATEAQALTIALTDLNDDDAPDILVGNDFGLPDMAWLQQPDGWQAARPFAVTSHSTMSFDTGDIDNDGRPELFATDMKPYADDRDTLAAWQPVMEMMAEHPAQDDVQIMENVLQTPTGNGHFTNIAPLTGLQATGWSWSAKFGDLDNDGFLDVYVVNGMAAQDLFEHLPNYELVEENQAFRNNGSGHFIPAPQWGLNATTGGRGMSMADLDNDGDLDIVVNNLLAPAQLFENQLCGGSSLEVDLFWPGSHNTRALGTKLSLQTSTGTYYREVKAGSGYLSGDPARVHFGFPDGSQLKSLEIIWPDGATSILTDVMVGQRLMIERL